MAVTSSFVTNQKILLAKIESTYGTDPTPALAANEVEAMDIAVSYPFELLERNIQKENLNATRPLTGKQMIEISFTCELKNGGTAGTSGRLSPLIQACGRHETIAVGTSVIYSNKSIGLKSCTIYLYEVNNTSSGNYLLHKLVGCVGNFEIISEAGQVAKIQFSFKAKYTKPTDVSDPGSPTYETTDGIVVNSSALTLDAEGELVVQAANFNLGNEIIERPDMDDSTSIHSFKITGRKPTLQLNPETVLVGEYDFFDDLENAEQVAFQQTIGSTAGNIVLLSGAKVSLDNVAFGDRNGMNVMDLPFHVNETELRIKMT